MRRKCKVIINSVLIVLLALSYIWYNYLSFTKQGVINEYCKIRGIQMCVPIVDYETDGKTFIIIEDGNDVYTLPIKRSGIFYKNAFLVNRNKSDLLSPPLYYDRNIYVKVNESNFDLVQHLLVDDVQYMFIYSDIPGKIEINRVVSKLIENQLPTYSLEYLEDGEDLGYGYSLVKLPSPTDYVEGFNEMANHVIRLLDSDNNIAGEIIQNNGNYPLQGILKKVNGKNIEAQEEWILINDVYLSESVSRSRKITLPDSKIFDFEIHHELFLGNEDNEYELRTSAIKLEFYNYNDDILMVETIYDLYGKIMDTDKRIFIMSQIGFENLLKNLDDIQTRTEAAKQ